MDSNFQGLLGYFLFITGLAVGGLTIVALAAAHYPYFFAGAVVAVASLGIGTLMWMRIARRDHHDPLEPGMTSAGVQRYRSRRRIGTC